MALVLNSLGDVRAMDSIKNEMKHFRAWAEDKPLLLSMVSFVAVTYADDCFYLYETIRAGKRLGAGFTLPSLRTWLNLYRNPKRVSRVLLSFFVGERVATQTVNAYLKSFKELGKITSKEEFQRKYPKEQLENSRESMRGFLGELIADFVNEHDDDEREKFIQFLNKPEMLFFLRVFIPCFSIYGTYPQIILKQAQKGDDKALENLIRLDKSLIFDRKISEIVHQAQVAKQQQRISMIKKAFSSNPKAKLNKTKIKYILGGLLSQISMLLKHKIEAADIHRLFDAFTIDTGKGTVDPDLIVTPETFEKAIQRARDFWNLGSRWTKNN